MATRPETVLNLAIVVLAACAIVITGAVVRREFVSDPAAHRLGSRRSNAGRILHQPEGAWDRPLAK